MRDYSLRSDFVTKEMAEERIFEKHGDNISLQKYTSSKGFATFKCNVCTNVWEARAYSVWRGNGCPNCMIIKASERYRLDFNFVKRYIEEEGCKLLSTEYKNSRTKLKIEFSCGHIGDMVWDVFKRGGRCTYCSHQRGGASSRIPEEKISEMMSNNLFSNYFFPKEYKDRNSIINYTCQYGHVSKKKFSMFLRSQTCTECTKIKQKIGQTGSKGSNWQGGLVLIRKFIKNKIKEWKIKSMESCNYKCIFTGGRFKHIHHLQSMNLILKEAISELDFETHELTGDYSDEEIFQLINKVKEVHDRYPLGVCLTESIHEKFHVLYGYGDTTPEDFYDFQRKVQSGEIQLEEAKRKNEN